MNNIIKRRKTSDYAQIHNGALQELDDIRSIGLISHLMSLPESWVINKMQLYSKFGRGPITNAIKELEDKKYWITIKYRDGKKNLYYYNVSDMPFTDTETLKMINEVIDAGFKIIELSASFSHLLTSDISSGENHQLNDSEENSFVSSSNVEFEQYILNTTESNIENQQILNTYLKTNSYKKIMINKHC